MSAADIAFLNGLRYSITSMQYQVYSKNLLVTDILREYLDEKLSHVDKLNVSLIACRVDISRDSHHKKGEVYRVEVNMTVPQRLLRVVEQHEDVRAAIDIVSDKLYSQLKKYKARNIDTKRRLGTIFKRGKQE